jgi:hypothetical protein
LRIASLQVSGANLLLGCSGPGSGTLYVLSTTNLALPLTQWRPVATNVLSGDGPFTLTATNAIFPNARAQFFILSTMPPN